MTLSAGTKLGPYEILAPIGAGGMGEVYRARDTRLGRTVAVKVLPAHLSGNAELRERFEREAKTISSISNAHICALYDVGRENGIDFLVMEYLEGETLSARLARGPMPAEQVVRFGLEIADALDKAHRQGIVHRDLKPGNIMLTKSGVKLLDFGLAKWKGAVVPAALSGLSAMPTHATPMTAEGSILGTFQYMAPEQLEGKEADPRSDIFAFGATLYEMATGRKAFEGKSQASLIAAILEHDPPSIATSSRQRRPRSTAWSGTVSPKTRTSASRRHTTRCSISAESARAPSRAPPRHRPGERGRARRSPGEWPPPPSRSPPGWDSRSASLGSPSAGRSGPTCFCRNRSS